MESDTQKLQDVNWLAQGTIYPDVIESAASKYGKAHVIKSHHNVGGLPERMTMQLVEPLCRWVRRFRYIDAFYTHCLM